MECLKGKFTGYIKSMENIFAANGGLGRQSFHEKIASESINNTNMTFYL